MQCGVRNGFPFCTCHSLPDARVSTYVHTHTLGYVSGGDGNIHVRCSIVIVEVIGVRLTIHVYTLGVVFPHVHRTNSHVLDV